VTGWRRRRGRRLSVEDRVLAEEHARRDPPVGSGSLRLAKYAGQGRVRKLALSPSRPVSHVKRPARGFALLCHDCVRHPVLLGLPDLLPHGAVAVVDVAACWRGGELGRQIAAQGQEAFRYRGITRI